MPASLQPNAQSFTSAIVAQHKQSSPNASTNQQPRDGSLHQGFLEIVMIVNSGLRGDGQVDSGERFHPNRAALLQSAADVHSGGSETRMLDRKRTRPAQATLPTRGSLSLWAFAWLLEAASLKHARKWLRWTRPPVGQQNLMLRETL
jgi:hypothetical protein